MRSDYFELFSLGAPGELALLDLPEKLKYIEQYKDLVMVEGILASVFANALSGTPGFQADGAAFAAFRYCADRARQTLPLHPGLLALAQRLEGSPERGAQAEILASLSRTPEQDRQLEKWRGDGEMEAVYPAMRAVLKANPAHAGAAAALLQADFACWRDPEDWLPSFKCPKRLAGLWLTELFLHYARRGLWRKALPLWEKMEEPLRSPYAHVYAADMYGLAGDGEESLALYRAALRLDPELAPVRRRIAELESPRPDRPELLHERKTALCVYCWNKGPMLEQTLRALARTNTGANPLFILLNGCTDDSRARVEALRPLFPGRPVEVVELPVNIGAPAARNWLINLPAVRACDHIAFMDDDVVMPKDWLVKFLTAMESDPQNAVVGCKVVFPLPPGKDEAPPLQYIYRSVCLTLPGALKLTIATPLDGQRDTGLYGFTRSCLNVMGCLHLLRNAALREVGGFDIRFSPSQVDDLDHDLCTCLKGYKVVYCGAVTCEHHQNSGVGTGRTGGRLSPAAWGSILGNDLKLNYKHLENLETLKALAAQMTGAR